MSENLLAFPIDIEKTLKHLRSDKDDWLYDAIRYEDLLSNGKSLRAVHVIEETV